MQKAKATPKRVTEAVIRDRIKRGKERIEYLIESGEYRNYEVRLMDGNGKTGTGSYTVSLFPFIDCCNCSGCWRDCYDLRNDIWRPACFENRCINSAIHKMDAEKYWWGVEKEIKDKFCTFLRVNVGGDLTNEDFGFMFSIADRRRKTDFHDFTKNYKGGNAELTRRNGLKPSNLTMIYSQYPGMEIENPYNIPVSHILFPDGSTTAPLYGAIACFGNCTECHFEEKGCFSLKEGDHVVFKYH